MSGPYTYAPAIWPSVLTALLLIALSVYSWKRHSVPGARVFAVTCLIAALWAAGSVMELAAADMECKILWFKFQGVWQLPAATASTCFVLEYTWPGRWLTRRNLALLSIPPLLVLGLVLTNDLHHLIWRAFAYDGTVIPLRGLGNWILFIYTYGLGILNLIVFAWLFVRSPQHRWPLTIMLTGQVVARALYLLEATHALRHGLPIDAPPVAFEYLMYAIALFGFHIFDPIPLARRQVIAQMHEGVLVLDLQGRVVSLNPAAQAILGTSDRRARAHLIGELVPSYSDQDAKVGESEISLPAGQPRKDNGTVQDGAGRCGTGPETRHYLVETSALKDWRGRAVGHLLLLRDVTEQKRAQAQFVEQQRALATLQERERLARELHDSAGQMLGYVSVQAQAIRKWVQEGQAATAVAQLTRLADAAQEAHADIRESIFSLKGGLAPKWSFLAALRQHLDSFQDHYGIRTELTIPAGLTDQAFEPVATVQLLRVIQEAMNNAHKHGRARCVRVAFEPVDSHARIVVADDGCGFDPGQLSAGAGDHLGLVFMRERIEQVGGRLTIESRPGAGAQVVFEVPVVDSER